MAQRCYTMVSFPKFYASNLHRHFYTFIWIGIEPLLSFSLTHTLSLNIQFSLLSVISRLSLLMDKPFCDPLSIVDMHCLEHSCNTPSLKSTSIMSWTTCKLTLHQHTANNITLQQAMRYRLPWQPLTSHNFTRLFNKRTHLLSMRLMKKVCIPLFY